MSAQCHPEASEVGRHQTREGTAPAPARAGVLVRRMLVSPEMCWATSLLAHASGQSSSSCHTLRGSGSSAAWRHGVWAGKATLQKVDKKSRDPRSRRLVRFHLSCTSHVLEGTETLIHGTLDKGR